MKAIQTLIYYINTEMKLRELNLGYLESK